MMLSELELTKKYAYFKRIGYEPHSKQKLFHNSGARFRLANCGRRFGKTFMSGHEASYVAMYPNKTIWIVGESYEQAEREFRVVWDDIINTLKLPTKRKAYNKEQGDMFIELPWGTTVIAKSAKYQDNLVGDGVDLVLLSEASKQRPEIFNRFLRPALADKRGGLIAGTTPEGQNWYYNEWLKGQDGTDPEYESWVFPSWENLKTFPKGKDDPEILSMRVNMSDESFEQEIAADFGSFQGKIYPEFQIDTHVIEYEYNPKLADYMCVDFGYTNPFACLDMQIDEDGTVYVWREHYQKFLTLDAHIDRMNSRDQPPGYDVKLIFADAADPEGVNSLSDKLAPCVADGRSKDNWREGVDIVRNKLKFKYLDSDGVTVKYVPKLYIDKRCVNLLREFNNYRANNPIKGRNVAECAIHQDDHALDALRYAMVHIFKLGYLGSIDALVDLNGVHEVKNRANKYDISEFFDAEVGYFTQTLEF